MQYNIQTYNLLKIDETVRYCTSCSKDVFLFSDLSNDNDAMNKMLDRTNDPLDSEPSSQYFDISDLLTAAFLKISSMEQIFPLNMQ